MTEFESEINSISTSITSICIVIAALIISIPKIMTSCKKRNQLELKIKHLNNLINSESRSTSRVNSIETPEPTHVVIPLEDLDKTQKRYSLANIQDEK